MSAVLQPPETLSRPQREVHRLLMVSNFLSSTGTSRGACEELADHLSRSGMDVITTSEKSNKIARLADMLATVWRCRDHYQVAQIDVYSGSAFLWAEAVCRLLRAIDKPFVLSLHGGALPRFAERWPRRVRRLLASAAVVTTPSRYLQEQMSPYRADLTLIPNSLDIQRYPCRRRERAGPNLVWLRSIHQIYNPVLAIEVLAALLPDHPAARLSMVGPDKGDGSRQSVEQRASELGVADHLTLCGVVPKSEVPRYLSAADIFLNTANIDNAPISVIEAMACGLCVVSTDVGGIPYLLTHERNALLVPARDAAAMIAAVRRILGDSDLASRLAENARRDAERFDWSITIPAWRTIFGEAVSKHHSSKCACITR